MAVAAGTLIAGRYRIIERVGSGGMGSVVLAQDTVLRRPVAIKRLHRDAEDVTARFRREAKLGASLNHPSLVAVYDAVPEEGDLLLIMEYVDGQTLRGALRAGPIPSQRTIAILTDVAAALDYMHGRGMVHRDVKPANILLGLAGEVKLADLGISWGEQMTQITASGALLGTPAYLAPELLAGERATAASDVYSLAAVAFEALSGRRAHVGAAPAEILQRIVTQPTPHLREAWPEAPDDAGRLLCQGMSPDPSGRPGSSGELVERLDASLARAPAPAPLPALAPVEVGRRESPSPLTPQRPRAPAATRSRSRPSLAALGALAAVAAVVALFVLTSGDGSRTGPDRTTAPPPTTTPSTSTTTDPGAATSASTDTPAGAAKAFYQRAASHRYDEAWALASPGLRLQLGGFDAFQVQFRSLRSIAFSRLQATNQTANRATVSIATTAVHTTRTDHCAGSVDLVPGGGAWMLEHIDVSC